VVTTNRKFQSPNGYSRQNGKRDVERLVAEELEPEPPSRLPRPHGSGPLPISRVTLEFGPRVIPRSGLDLRAVTAPAHWKQQLKQMLLRSWQAAAPLLAAAGQAAVPLDRLEIAAGGWPQVAA
jgi:hypothetical protein